MSRAGPAGKGDQEIKRVLKLSPHDDSVELGIGDPRNEDEDENDNLTKCVLT